jgi:hypothetical protein
MKRTVGDPVRKIKIKVFAVGREYERAIANFEAVEPNRISLV